MLKPNKDLFFKITAQTATIVSTKDLAMGIPKLKQQPFKHFDNIICHILIIRPNQNFNKTVRINRMASKKRGEGGEHVRNPIYI